MYEFTTSETDAVHSILQERDQKCYPTAPLHSDGTTVGGHCGVALYVGWKFKGDTKLTNAWRAFVRSDKSDLPQMVPNIKKLIADMEKMLGDDNEVDGDEDENDRSEPDGTEIFLHYLKLCQEFSKEDADKYLHLFSSEEVMGENSDQGNIVTYDNIIIGVKLGNKKDRWNFTREQLAAEIDVATKELLVKFPKYDQSEIRVMINGDYQSGNCY